MLIKKAATRRLDRRAAYIVVYGDEYSVSACSEDEGVNMSLSLSRCYFLLLTSLLPLDDTQLHYTYIMSCKHTIRHASISPAINKLC